MREGLVLVGADPPELDPVVHAPIRLAALSLLASVDEAEFTYLREKIGATDGNLSVHLTKLETAGYVDVEKKFVGKRPKTLYRMTETGRAAFLGYVRSLKTLLGDGPWSRRS
jgi:DNA-binding transcriptional ArsR family regulator